MKRTYDKRLDEINVERNMINLKIRIREMRKEMCLTQQKLAEEIGVKRSNVASWEAGTRVPNANQLKSLSEYFNVTSDYLLGFVNNKYEKMRTDTLLEYRKNKKWIK